MVVKNSLARRATEGTSLSTAFEGIEGSHAVLWGAEDFVSLVKEVNELDKDEEDFRGLRNLVLKKRESLAQGKGSVHHRSIPAMVAVMNAARDPATIARNPSFERSCLRDGANPPIPPNWMAMEEKFANPDRA